MQTLGSSVTSHHTSWVVASLAQHKKEQSINTDRTAEEK
jgi:hypothetical protein